MASIFKRKRSPYWYIKRKDIDGEWIMETTKYRTDNQQETKLARSECAKHTSNELGDVGIQDVEKWDAWVDRFINTHCGHPDTRKTYLRSWQWIRTYLAEKRIMVPAQLTYQDAFDFIDWRMGKVGGIKSTAMADLKVLRVVMRHAVRSGIAQGNPCDKMGIKRPAAKVKPELSDEDIRAIYKGLKEKDAWMQLAFSICLHTGCRISEANLDRIDVDSARRTITFRDPKGGTEKAFTTVMSAELDEIIKTATKKHPLVDLIPPKCASQHFSKLFKKLKIKGSIHCTRVTLISRLARTSVPERVTRLAVNHANATVHRIYQRLGVDDLRQLDGAVKFPQPSGTKSKSRRASPSPRK